jgi:hypothetical protein
MKKIVLFVLVLLLATDLESATLFGKDPSGGIEKGLFDKSIGKNEEVIVKKPKAGHKAEKKQEAKDKKLKKDYDESIKRSQKRTFDIQTPDVKARMKQNQKDSAARDKAKKKKMKTGTKKAGIKYR